MSSRFYQVPSMQSGGGPLLPTSFPDISNYKNTELYIYIAVAVLFVDLIVLFLVRYFPKVFGEPINEWYDKFKLGAVLSDVTIIILGFFIAMYIYTEWIAPKQGWSLPLFLLTLVGVQVIHDMFFYKAVIQPIPSGHNNMIDVFKRYAASGGYKILLADAAMMIGAAGLTGLLKQYPFYITPMLGVLGLYAVPYILETVPHSSKPIEPPPPATTEEQMRQEPLFQLTPPLPQVQQPMQKQEMMNQREFYP